MPAGEDASAGADGREVLTTRVSDVYFASMRRVWVVNDPHGCRIEPNAHVVARVIELCVVARREHDIFHRRS